MKVFVNNTEIDIFRGATIIDAVRAYSPEDAKLLLSEILMAADRYGNRTDVDGELVEGQEIKLIKKRSK